MSEGLVVPIPQIPQMQQEDFLQEVANAEEYPNTFFLNQFFLHSCQ